MGLVAVARGSATSSSRTGECDRASGEWSATGKWRVVARGQGVVTGEWSDEANSHIGRVASGVRQASDEGRRGPTY